MGTRVFGSIGLIAWLAFAASVLTVVFEHVSIESSDFRAFYESGLAWRQHRPDDQRSLEYPNLNPPTLAPVVAPLTFIPVRTAFWVWTLLGTCSFAASLRIVSAARRVSWRNRLWIIGALGAMMPCLAVWIPGQITWVLLYPITRAWASTSRVRAGLWMAPVIALKPPLALMAILLPWPIPGVAAASSAALTALGVFCTGWPAWQDWLHISGRVTWISWPLNASLWGWAGRARSTTVLPTGMADLPLAFWIVVGVAGALTAGQVLRTRGDVRWLLALWWGLLISPLGWIYYLPLGLGPMVGSWRWNVWCAMAFGLFIIPIPIIAVLVHWQSYAAWLINSIYGIGLILAWVGWTLGRGENNGASRPRAADLAAVHSGDRPASSNS